MPLLYLADGRARPVDAAELPSLVADAHDDADALGALTEIALSLDEDAARAAAGAALARLRALRREGRAGGVDVDALAAQLGAALHAARARDDVDARDVAGAPVRAPVWRGALAVTEPLVPRAALPGVVLFALSDETAREAGHAAPTRTAALARALPLAVGERVLPHADALVVVPVVAGRGAYVATKA